MIASLGCSGLRRECLEIGIMVRPNPRLVDLYLDLLYNCMWGL